MAGLAARARAQPGGVPRPTLGGAAAHGARAGGRGVRSAGRRPGVRAQRHHGRRHDRPLVAARARRRGARHRPRVRRLRGRVAGGLPRARRRLPARRGAAAVRPGCLRRPRAGRRRRAHAGDIRLARHFDHRAGVPAGRAGGAGAGARHRRRRRRRPRARPAAARPRRAGCRRLHRQLPQVAVRPARQCLPARAARRAAPRARAGGELGLCRRRGRRRPHRLRRLHRPYAARAPAAMAGHARRHALARAAVSTGLLGCARRAAAARREPRPRPGADAPRGPPQRPRTDRARRLLRPDGASAGPLHRRRGAAAAPVRAPPHRGAGDDTRCARLRARVGDALHARRRARRARARAGRRAGVRARRGNRPGLHAASCSAP